MHDAGFKLLHSYRNWSVGILKIDMPKWHVKVQRWHHLLQQLFNDAIHKGLICQWIFLWGSSHWLRTTMANASLSLFFARLGELVRPPAVKAPHVLWGFEEA